MNTFTSRLIVSVACASQWILYIYLHVVFSLLSTWISIHLLESVVHLIRPWKEVSLHHGNYSAIKPTVRTFSLIKFTSAYFLRMYLTIDFATPDTVAFFGWIFFLFHSLRMTYFTCMESSAYFQFTAKSSKCKDYTSNQLQALCLSEQVKKQKKQLVSVSKHIST